MHKELMTIQDSWREKGAAFILAHPDDEVLFFSMMECLC